MAEAAGLALGTVAVASLFRTCLELIDYFELSKSYEYDYEMACLKLSLLQSRLDTCRQTLQSGASDCCQQNHSGNQWGLECTVIRRSLQGIADILGSADLLKDKYCLLPRKSRNKLAIVKSGQPNSFTEPKGKIPYLSCRAGVKLSYVRRSTSWAIRDKPKFDILIADLDFFISNLEAVSSRAQLASNIPYSAMNEKDNSPQFTSNSSNAGSTSSGVYANQSCPRGSSTPSQPLMVQRQDYHRSALQVPSSTASSLSTTSRSLSIEGHQFIIQRMEDRSAAFLGTVDDAKMPPAPAGQVVNYQVGVTKDDSRVMGGTMTSANFDVFFNGPLRESSSSRPAVSGSNYGDGP